MCDVERYIDDYDEQMARREVFNLVNELHDLCDQEDNLTDKQKLDEKFENKLKPSEIAPCNPCGCKDTSNIEESIHNKIDDIKHEFIDSKALSFNEIDLIYKYTELIKSRC